MDTINRKQEFVLTLQDVQEQNSCHFMIESFKTKYLRKVFVRMFEVKTKSPFSRILKDDSYLCYHHYCNFIVKEFSNDCNSGNKIIVGIYTKIDMKIISFLNCDNIFPIEI